MRIALIVGINYYQHVNALFGCVDDAHSVKTILERHGDGTVNFGCKLLTATGSSDQVTRRELKDRIIELFKSPAQVALFYFAGHGHIESTGGYLLGSDARQGDEGLSLTEVLSLANGSPAQNRIILLDSCHSGIAGTPPMPGNFAALTEGMTVLTASTADQYATEENGHGIFTRLLIDALHGGAANLTSDVTPGSVYAHIDQSLGEWDQRPVFKANVREFVSLRKVTEPISLAELRRIKDLFPVPGFEFALDPTFEPEERGRDPGTPSPMAENVERFVVLQKYNRLNLLTPVGVPHMWSAAMQSKSCKLTALGEHYRRLAAKGRI